MKKIPLFSIFLVAFLFTAPAKVHAASWLSKLPSADITAVDVLNPLCNPSREPGIPVPAEKPAVCNDNKSDPASPNPFTGPDGIFAIAIRLLAIIGAISAIIVIIISGLRIIFSNGDASTVAGARKQLIMALVGLAVIAVSSSLVYFVIGRVL